MFNTVDDVIIMDKEIKESIFKMIIKSIYGYNIIVISFDEQLEILRTLIKLRIRYKHNFLYNLNINLKNYVYSMNIIKNYVEIDNKILLRYLCEPSYNMIGVINNKIDVCEIVGGRSINVMTTIDVNPIRVISWRYYSKINIIIMLIQNTFRIYEKSGKYQCCYNKYVNNRITNYILSENEKYIIFINEFDEIIICDLSGKIYKKIKIYRKCDKINQILNINNNIIIGESKEIMIYDITVEKLIGSYCLDKYYMFIMKNQLCIFEDNNIHIFQINDIVYTLKITENINSGVIRSITSYENMISINTNIMSYIYKYDVNKFIKIYESDSINNIKLITSDVWISNCKYVELINVSTDYKYKHNKNYDYIDV